MDPVSEIKAKLPIEELVGEYCALNKKGKSFMCLCPFHNDKKPSFLVSPDKGIAYCFVCQTGGDIFSFYQAIEGVEFKQALKDLAEKTGVKVETTVPTSGVKKDEKDRARECLQSALSFFQENLKTSEKAKAYIESRSISSESIETFQIGFAPDSFSDTYQYLLKKGFSKKEILDASLAIQKDLAEGKMYDRFRNRIMFPIFDHKGGIVGFGGRTIGDDDAKYINSAESPLYNKSHILFGLHLAKDSMRESKSVTLVEGYTDVIACHRLGIKNTVAVSGTALTEEHVKLLKRYVEKVVLCLDADAAGRDAATRAFGLCMKEDLRVHIVNLNSKDPDEMSKTEPEVLKKLLEEEGMLFLDAVLEELIRGDVRSAEGKHAALQTVLPLLREVKSSVERSHYMGRVAALLGTTELALEEDLQRIPSDISPVIPVKEENAQKEKNDFSRIEVVLGLLLMHSKDRSELLSELIPCEEGFAGALYSALEKATEDTTVETLEIAPEHKERASILLLYSEHHGFADWSQGLAKKEIQKMISVCNRDHLREKQRSISQQILQAQKEGKEAEVAKLMNQYTQVLKLANMAS